MTNKKESISNNLKKEFKKYINEKITKGECLVLLFWCLCLTSIFWLVILTKNHTFRYRDTNDNVGTSTLCYTELTDRQLYCLVPTVVKEYSEE